MSRGVLVSRSPELHIHEMIDVKPDTDDPSQTASSSMGHTGGHSRSRPTSSSHNLDTSALANALPSSHQMAGIRSRITVVCAECKRLKLKCDRRTPCSSCVKRDTLSRCIYTAAAAEKIDVQSLHNRVSTLEARIIKMSTDGYKMSGMIDSRPTSLVAVSHGSSVVVSLDDVAGVWLDELEVTLDIDLKPLEPEVPAELGWAQLFPSPEVFFNSPDPNAGYGGMGDPVLPSVTVQSLEKLPGGTLRDVLLAQFQNTLAMHPCTNWNDFTQRLHTMFAAVPPQEHEVRMSNGMFPPPPPPPSTPTPITFFASVAAGFALGAQSLSEMMRWGPSQMPFEGPLPSAQQLHLQAEQYFSLSQSALQVAQRTAAYDLDFLISMRLQCLYLLHDGKPRVAHSVLPEVGRMINIARCMGLHIDPDEHPGKYSLFDSEMRRRVWWDIYYLDLFISDCMALPALIDDSTFTCRMPTDCDDMQLHQRTSLMTPPSEHSNFTYFILKCRLAQLVKKIRRRSVRDEHGELDPDAALALENEVKAWVAELPLPFQLPADEAGAASGSPFLVAQRCELAAIANQMLLKIYHPFLRRDIHGKAALLQPMHASVEAAHILVHASKTLHTVLRHTRPATYVFYSFGRQLFHAAVIAAHTVIQNPLSVFVRTALKDLEDALHIMRDPMLATGRGPARGGEGSPSEALRVVEMLHTKAEQAIRGNLPSAGQKRKYGDVDEHLLPNFQIPYVGAAVATVSDDGEPQPMYSGQVAMQYQHMLQYPNPAMAQTPDPQLEQPQPQRVQQQAQRQRMPTHPPPPQDVESPYVPVGPAPETWQYQQKPPSGGAKDRKAHPHIGVRRRETEPKPSRPRLENPSSSGSGSPSSHSPIAMRKPSSSHGTSYAGPPPTSGVAMPGAAQFQQAQEYAQSYAASQPGMPSYYTGGNGMYAPQAQQQPQQGMYPYGPAHQEPQQQPSFEGTVNPQLISPEVQRSMPMHMSQQARASMAPSIPSTPVDPSRYNTVLPSAPAPPTKQDVEDADQPMLTLPDAALNPGFEVALGNMTWDPNAREAYPAAEWQGYGFS